MTCGCLASYPRIPMYGFKLSYVKKSVLLLAALIALILAWSDLSRAFFIIITACAAVAGFTGWLARNALAQTRGDDSRSARVATRPRLERTSRPRRERTSRTRARAQRAEELHPEETVTLSREREAADIDDVFAALDNQLVGLVPVKSKVEEIASLLLVDRVRNRFGLQAPRPNLHMCFTGDPGTGKTTVALQMADLLSRLGYLEKGHLVHAMRDDLVGEFIGQTAPKTRRILERSMGGVLFIDEAYYLYRGDDSRDYGQECIDILLQVMENDRDKLVVILAGYKDRMDGFFESNPGMSSRIAHHLDFAPYKLDELVAIGRSMLDRSSYYLSAEAEVAFRDYLTLRMAQPRFANARSVRNELERSRLRHAHRLAAEPERSRTKDDLMRLEAVDILASPLFALAEEPVPAVGEAAPRG